MSRTKGLASFVKRYLNRSLVGVSVGLAGVSAQAAVSDSKESAQPASTEKSQETFGDRLEAVRSTASSMKKDASAFRLAQISNFGSFSNYQQDGMMDESVSWRKEHGN